MKNSTSTLTTNGRGTIPVGIRKSLGLKPGDRVTFVLDEGAARILRAKSSLDASFGAVRPKQRPENLELVCEQATQEAALKRLDKARPTTRLR